MAALGAEAARWEVAGWEVAGWEVAGWAVAGLAVAVAAPEGATLRVHPPHWVVRRASPPRATGAPAPWARRSVRWTGASSWPQPCRSGPRCHLSGVTPHRHHGGHGVRVRPPRRRLVQLGGQEVGRRGPGAGPQRARVS